MDNFFYALKPTGFLVIGASESVGTAASLFAIVDEQAKIYAKRATAVGTKVLKFKHAEPPKAFDRVPEYSPTPAVTEADPIRLAEKLVLEKYAPAWILVNQAMDIVHFKGQTARFISHRSGEPSWNLFKMLRDDLITDVRVLLHASLNQQGPVRKNDIEFREGNHARLLNLLAVPVLPAGSDPHVIVVFLDRPAPRVDAKSKARQDSAGIAKLKAELASTQKSLRSFLDDQNATNEELQSANEEILSSNEELQSTNEELETAKEELQSTNEELVTVNEELSNRNRELNETNNDLSNVLTNAQGAIVIVNGDLRIRRLTPPAAALLKVGLKDIGRKLTDFNLGFSSERLEEKIHEVIQSVTVLDFEERNKAGQYYSIRIRPYKTVDNRIDGAVISFIDIDDFKNKEHNLRATQKYSDAIIQATHDPLLVLDEDLRVERVNPAFYRTFKVTEADTVGKYFYDLGNGQWDIPDLRKLLEELLPRQSEIEDYKVTHKFEGLGVKTMFINACRLEWKQSKEVLILLAIRELKPAAEKRSKAGKK